MIESIQFKNFKCLRDTTLPLSACTILVGPNGSGKSTVLQALEIVSGKPGGRFSDVVTANLRENDKAGVEIRLHLGRPLDGVSAFVGWSREVFDAARGSHCQKPLSDRSLIGRFVTAIRVYSLDAHAAAQPVELEPTMELRRDGAGLAGVLTRLQDRHQDRFEALNEELGRWLPEFDRVLFDVDNSKKRVLLLRTREDRNAIPASGLSQGTLIALAMLTLAYLPEPPSVVGLEEPDRGIHPRLLRHVQDAIYRLSHPDPREEDREPVQVIATTHSPYFLDLFKDHPEEIVIANKTGLDVQFQRLSERPDIHEILGDASLGEAWFTGVLGGVPARS